MLTLICFNAVVRDNGSIPIRYGILAGIDDRISHIKAKLSLLTASPVSRSSTPSPTCDDSCSSSGGGIPPENLILTEIRAHRFLHIFSDNQKVKGAFSSRPIYAYEVNIPVEYDGQGDTVQQSVDPKPTVAETDQQIKRILTSAKNANSAQNTLKPVEPQNQNGPSHSRQSSYSSSCGGSTQTSQTDGCNNGNYMVVVHRKIFRQETYFLASQKASSVLFGMPLVVPYYEGMTHLELYKRVWSLVARLVSPLPPSEGPNISNHAYDW